MLKVSAQTQPKQNYTRKLKSNSKIKDSQDPESSKSKAKNMQVYLRDTADSALPDHNKGNTVKRVTVELLSKSCQSS
jgi:hypothetical protein